MAIELMTGNGSIVTSMADSQLYAGLAGRGSYVLDIGEKLPLTMADANTLVVGTGCVLHNGRHIRFKGTTEFTIPSGTQGQKRAHIAVARIHVERDEGSFSDDAFIEPIVLSGSPVSSGNPVDPSLLTDNLLDGATVTDFPIARVTTDGINVQAPVALFDRDAWHCLSQKATKTELTTGLAGKAAASHTHTAANITDLKSWILNTFLPVGRYYFSEVNKSPASFLGGTWVQVSGYFLYMATSTATGGANNITLTTAQIPSHSHYVRVNWHDKGARGAVWPGWSNSANLVIDPSGLNSGATGGGGSHSNVPLYKGVFAWRRTA